MVDNMRIIYSSIINIYIFIATQIGETKTLIRMDELDAVVLLNPRIQP